MEKYVKLEDVVKLILEEGLYCDTKEDREYSAERVRELPAADVKTVVRGKWIDEGTFADNNNAHAYMCSNCCSHVIEYPEEIKDQHFCYNCGADMREAEK